MPIEDEDSEDDYQTVLQFAADEFEEYLSDQENRSTDENINDAPLLPPGTNYNKDGFLNQLFYDGYYYAFKEVKILKSSERVAYYRCRHYKGTAEIPGCKSCFRLVANELVFSEKPHTCQFISNKKRKITVDNVLDISLEMKEYVEEVALKEVSKPAKEIAMKAAEFFKQKYIGNFR